jgi:hypothetical protein
MRLTFHQLERLEATNREPVDRSAKVVAMRKELDELQKLHEDGRRAVSVI